MKRYIVLLLMVLSLISKAQNGLGVRFSVKTYEEALALAKETHKFIFIDFRADWCKPCIEMEQTTFKDSAVGALINSQFIALKADVDFFAGMDLKEQYNVNQYPTLLIVNEYEEVQMRMIGFKPASVLIEDLNYVLQRSEYYNGGEDHTDWADESDSESPSEDDKSKKKKCFLFRKD